MTSQSANFQTEISNFQSANTEKLQKSTTCVESLGSDSANFQNDEIISLNFESVVIRSKS